MLPATLDGQSWQNLAALTLVALAVAHLAWRAILLGHRFWSMPTSAGNQSCAGGCHGCGLTQLGAVPLVTIGLAEPSHNRAPSSREIDGNR